MAGSGCGSLKLSLIDSYLLVDSRVACWTVIQLWIGGVPFGALTGHFGCGVTSRVAVCLLFIRPLPAFIGRCDVRHKCECLRDAT